MAAHPRQVKKHAEVKPLRALSPSETLQMGLELVEFAKRFSEAADRARL